jgi:heptosyltransferase-2
MKEPGTSFLDGSDRILIRSTNWIGDAVMSMAALREIRRLYPEAHLALFARRWVAGLFEGQRVVDEIISFDNDQSTLKWRQELQSYDAALLFQNAFEAALLAFLSRIPKRIGYSTQGRGFLLNQKARPRIKKLNRHQVYYYLDLLFQTGVSHLDYLNSPDFQPDISFTATSQSLEGADQLLKELGIDQRDPLIGINPGAFYGSAKRWLTDRYAALADLLVREKRTKVLIFGSEGERPIAEEIESHMKERPFILTGRTDLPALMGTMSRCRIFITNDSGPMHLAAALGVPQIAIFGSTDEIATGPFSEKAVVIHKHVDCSPCLLRECPKDLRCYKRITVEEVFETVEGLLEE